MDINLLKAVTPVSPGLASASGRGISVSSATSGVAVALPILGDGGVSKSAAPPVGLVQKPADQPQPAFDPKVQLEAIARQLQDYLQSSQRDIEFRVDADTGTQVVTVRDATTGDVIRQMPSEEVLRVMRNLYQAQGSLLNTKA